jgi:hypothetical protein
MEVTQRWHSSEALAFALAILASSFSCRSSTTSNDANATPRPTQAVPAVTQAPTQRHSPAPNFIDLLGLLQNCDIDHGGLIIDLGVPLASNGPGSGLGSTFPSELNQGVDRAGSTFLSIKERRYTREFWLDEPTDQLIVRARVAGRSGTAFSLWVDGHRLGRKKLTRNEISVVTFPSFPERIEAGRHTIMLEAHGRAVTPPEPWFDVDWLQLRRDPDQVLDDSAPTLRDIIADQEIDGVPRRSIVLRAASTIRCPFHLSGPTELNLALGFWGSGRGTAEIRVLEEGQPPKTITERKIAGGNGSRWTPLTIDLSPFADRVIALELRATAASQGGRVAFGEPHLARMGVGEGQRPLSAAKTVVVVLAAGLERWLVPPWGPNADRATLVDLKREAIAFDGYRVPTTIPAGIVASLLTGLSPMIHRVEDTAARLSRATLSLSEVIKQAGGRTAMFTGVPTTFAAFGFNVSWDDYGAYSPVLDLSAETPIVEATRWLARELDHGASSTRFVLVHARGAHPPWDLSKEQTAQLEPAEYAGSLDARRAGITLGRMRRQTKVQRRLGDEDNLRLRAMMGAAFSRQAPRCLGGNPVCVRRRHREWGHFNDPIRSSREPARGPVERASLGQVPQAIPWRRIICWRGYNYGHHADDPRRFGPQE